MKRYMATHGFDGVDLALEFPDADVPDDRIALTTLLEVNQKREESPIFIVLFRSLTNRDV